MILQRLKSLLPVNSARYQETGSRYQLLRKMQETQLNVVEKLQNADEKVHDDAAVKTETETTREGLSWFRANLTPTSTLMLRLFTMIKNDYKLYRKSDCATLPLTSFTTQSKSLRI